LPSCCCRWGGHPAGGRQSTPSGRCG
jgi:hypothetical protein